MRDAIAFVITKPQLGLRGGIPLFRKTKKLLYPCLDLSGRQPA